MSSARRHVVAIPWGWSWMVKGCALEQLRRNTRSYPCRCNGPRATACLETGAGTRHGTRDLHVPGTAPLLSAFASVWQAHHNEPSRLNSGTFEMRCHSWKVTGACRGRELSWPRTRVGVVLGECPTSLASAWRRRVERHRFRFSSARA